MSGRRVSHGLAALAVAALAAGGCAGPRHVVTFAPDGAGGGEESAILVATSRSAVDDPEIFSRDRSGELSFARFVVSVPPDRPPGVVTWPGRGAPDPRRDFLTVGAVRLGRDAFVAAIEDGLNADGWDEAIIYVHGYNPTFAEGLYRHVQMDVDFNMPDVAISYGWPSAGTLRGYAYDKESAIFAAEGLADLVELVARSRVSQITLVGHSMGTFVVMEALRILDLRGDVAALRGVHAVALLAPDLDLDIFRQRMNDIAGREIPVYVFVSGEDRALAISAMLQGGRPRLGAVTDPATVADLPVTLIDVSAVGASDPYGHDTVAESPLMIALVRGLDETGAETFADIARGDSSPLERGLHAVEHASRVAIDPMQGP